MKRMRFVCITAFVLLISSVGCTHVSPDKQASAVLTSTMTEEERSRISVGECSLLAASTEP